MKNINENDRFLNVELHGSTIILYINYCLLLENKTFEYRDEIIEYFDRLNNDDSIKVIVIGNDHPGYSLEKFKKNWNDLYSRNDYEDSILRAFRIYDQLLLKIKSLDKVIISMDSQSVNPMLFNFRMAVDIRLISNDFYLDNGNVKMVNIPKGGSIYSEAPIKPFSNPIKLLFFTEKLFSTDLLNYNIVDQVFYSENLKEGALKIAKKYESVHYSEIEAIKGMYPRRIRALELALQRENEFLISCIRKRKNKKTQEIHRFH